MNLIKEIFSGSKTFHAAIFLASVLFVFLFSTSTSPLYNSLGDDSAIFQAVGKGWAQGHLPYVDLFENKGPLIFLIDALGYMIYPRVGIFILQIPAMYLSFILAWRALSLYLSGKARVATAVFTFVYYALYSLDGNRTEEWSMPFLMAATYFFLRGLKEERFSCPPLVGLINGLGFGACVLLRTTNALPLCCCTFLSALFLIQARDFKALWQNVMTFCAGAVTIVLPFVIYFATHGALYDMLYGTILLNLNYSAQRENFLITHLDEYSVYIVIHFMPLFIMIAISLREFIRNKSRTAFSAIFIATVMLILLFKLSPYQGYCALITPLLPILFVMLAALAKSLRELWSSSGFFVKKFLCRFVIVSVMLYPLILAQEVVTLSARNNSESIRQYHVEKNIDMLRLGELIPHDERGSVMIWGEGTHVSHWILTTGIYPRCQFFGNVKAFAHVDPNVKREWLAVARANPPQWIIYSAPVSEFTGDYPDDWTKHFRQNRDADIERLLQERYNLVDKMETYQNFFGIYRLKR